jgi:hypothetical protein
MSPQNQFLVLMETLLPDLRLQMSSGFADLCLLVTSEHLLASEILDIEEQPPRL